MCEVVANKLACRAALTISWITIYLYHSDGMSTWGVVVLEIPAGTGVARRSVYQFPWKESTEVCITSANWVRRWLLKAVDFSSNFTVYLVEQFLHRTSHFDGVESRGPWFYTTAHAADP